MMTEAEALLVQEQKVLRAIRQISMAFPGAGVSTLQVGARMNLVPGDVIAIAMALEKRGLLTLIGDPDAISTAAMKLTRIGVMGTVEAAVDG